MSLNLRRTLCGLMAALGIALMMPLAVNVRRISAELESDPTAVGWMLDAAQTEWLSQATGLFLLGVLISAGFLYLALSTGYGKSWRPRRNGTSQCGRCGAPLQAGLAHCPGCDQRLTW
ncbi:MAG: hypothetical protein JSU87_00090 [Gemmatimonadota bacterium]|nr:MAG: hypothetical protein JSU87_00090 [Gemmatimonadota bacterium]